MLINITDVALEKIKALRKKEGYDDSYNLRITVNGGGCSGLMKKLSYDNLINEKDKLEKFEDISIIIDNKSLLYIIGTTIDYLGGLNGTGFIFNIPQATRTCSCGESFSV